ncbi:MAG: hypothetical protein ABIQ16_01975 [Polyangiaceae bacterium]
MMTGGYFGSPAFIAQPFLLRVDLLEVIALVNVEAPCSICKRRDQLSTASRADGGL